MIKAHRGLTITEVMVSLAIVVIGVLVFAGMQAFFASDTKNRFIYACLGATASNGISLCLSGQSIPSTIQCGNMQINLSVNGNCQPSTSCNSIISTASYNGLIYQETDYACP